jgi:hypothetical protein
MDLVGRECRGLTFGMAGFGCTAATFFGVVVSEHCKHTAKSSYDAPTPAAISCMVLHHAVGASSTLHCFVCTAFLKVRLLRFLASIAFDFVRD